MLICVMEKITETKKKAGRPRKEDAKKAVRIGVSMEPEQKIKLRELGGSRWIQKQIDKVI